MKKLFFLLIWLPCLAIAQNKKMEFKIDGTFKNAPADISKLFISYSEDGERVTDSIILKNGKYNFSGKISEPVLASIRVQYAPQGDGKIKALSFKRDVANVFLQKGRIKVISTDSMTNLKVSGSAAHKEYVKLNDETKPYNEKLNALYTRYNEYYKNKDEVNMKKLDDEIEVLSSEMSDNVYGSYAKSNPNSPLSVYAVKQVAGWDIVPEKVEPLFNTLPESVQQWPSAVKLKEQIETAKKTGIGKNAIEFTQNDTLGIPVSLSSFRGKYLLIDFWGSWCGPCRQENPNVVKAFQKYKERGFHILGVSLDREGQKEKWMKAIHDDKLEWSHVSDLKFWQNEVAVMYGIQAIPQNLLINPEGIIIAKNLRGEELDKKLESFIVEGKKAF